MDWRDYITMDPARCHGAACFKGTRIMVSVVLDNLAAGADEAGLLASYPSLTSESIRAALACAGRVCRDVDPAAPF